MIVRPDKPRAPAAGQKRIRARVLIIEARFYEAIADGLAAGAVAALEVHGADYDRVVVPGALEIPQVLAQATAAGLIRRRDAGGKWDGVIALGCVIRGETSHYDIVCNNANHWLMQVATEHAVPIGNGILTVDNEAQAIARVDADKGGDAARACLRLVELQREFEGQSA
jgi:6,7-dimethyl-8-ribityllumazine synthase